MIPESILKKLEEKNIDIHAYSSLAHLLTGMQSNENTILYLEDPRITEEVKEKIEKKAAALEEYIRIFWKTVDFNYHEKSNNGCYFLSTLFSFASGFDLVQSYTEINGYPSFHSWVEQEGIIYDPANRIVTTKEKYHLLYVEEDHYTSEEAKEMYEQTATFTHYRRSLTDPNFDKQIDKSAYRTPLAHLVAVREIDKLEAFLDEKEYQHS